MAVDGRSLNPDYAGAFAQGQQRANVLKNQRLKGELTQQQIGQGQRQAEQENQFNRLSGNVLSGQFDEGQNRQQAISEMIANNPEKAKGILNSLGINNQTNADEASSWAYTLQNTPQDLRPALIQQRVEKLTAEGRDPSDTASFLTMSPEQQDQVSSVVQMAALSTKDRLAQEKKPAGQEAFQKSEQGLVFNPNTGTYTVDPTAKARFDEVQSGKLKDKVIPQTLLENVDPVVAEKGSAAYTAAGGGKDGLVAFTKVVDAGNEQEKRTASPAMLKTSFPKASPAEMAQLQATMDASKTTAEGLKAAGLLRENQRRDAKGKAFQTRAVDLLTGIIDSPDLGDVTGSIEGSYDFRPFSDDESALIADIEEAGNILTSDNLSLMSGVLSETDIKILKNLAGGGLIRTRGEDRFRGDVTKLRDKLASELIVTADETAAQRANSGGAPSGKAGGVLNTDAQGNKAWVFPDGSFEEVQ